MPTTLLIGLAVAGVGMAGAGYMQARSAAKDQNKYQQEMIAQQQQLEAQRMKQMQLESRRRSLEVLRQSQRARSGALAVANSQGAMFGSGLQGAYGQASGQAGTQLVAGMQNLEIGQNMFSINSAMSQSKIGYANATSNYQAGQGLMSLGGSLVQASGQLSRVGGAIGSSMGMPPTGFNSPFANYGR